MRKWSWIFVVLLPLIAASETISTIGAVDFAYRAITPKYVPVTESQLAELDSKLLAKATISAIEEHKKMAEWWRWAGNTYETTTYILLGLVFMLAAILAIVLWRMPSNPALESGRAKSGATAQRKR